MRGLICDDHPMMREAVVAALQDRWPDLTLVEAADFPAAWAAAEASAPDFCLVDLAMPGADPLDGLVELRRRAPGMVVLVLTGLAERPLLDAVRALGVDGLFSKNTDADLLVEAVRAAVPDLQALEAVRLPKRRQEVLGLLAEGLTNKEIAQRLGISPATVKIHVARLTAWLGAANRTEAVARAQRARLI